MKTIDKINRFIKASLIFLTGVFLLFPFDKYYYSTENHFTAPSEVRLFTINLLLMVIVISIIFSIFQFRKDKEFLTAFIILLHLAIVYLIFEDLDRLKRLLVRDTTYYHWNYHNNWENGYGLPFRTYLTQPLVWFGISTVIYLLTRYFDKVTGYVHIKLSIEKRSLYSKIVLVVLSLFFFNPQMLRNIGVEPEFNTFYMYSGWFIIVMLMFIGLLSYSIWTSHKIFDVARSNVDKVIIFIQSIQFILVCILFIEMFSVQSHSSYGYYMERNIYAQSLAFLKTVNNTYVWIACTSIVLVLEVIAQKMINNLKQKNDDYINEYSKTEAV